MFVCLDYKVDPTDLHLSGLEAFTFDYIVKWPVSLVLNRKVSSFLNIQNILLPVTSLYAWSFWRRGGDQIWSSKLPVALFYWAMQIGYLLSFIDGCGIW